MADDKGKQKKEVVLNWEERTLDDSFQDARDFAVDLAVSLKRRLDMCTTNGVKQATFFDIKDTFTFLSGQRLPNGKVILKEGDLEEHGVLAFKIFFSEICALPSVKSLDDPRFDPRLSSSVLHYWKKGLRKLVWEKNMTQDLLSCLESVKKNGIKSSLLMDFETFLIKLKPLDVDKHKMETRIPFRFEFANHGPLEAYVKEKAVLEALYTKRALYDEAGQVGMIAFDICMSLGGYEAVCESFYSVMATQRQVGQSNSTLEDKTLVDWSTYYAQKMLSQRLQNFLLMEITEIDIVHYFNVCFHVLLHLSIFPRGLDIACDTSITFSR